MRRSGQAECPPTPDGGVGGAGNPQGVARLAELIRENVRRFAAGEPLLHRIAVQAPGEAA